MESPPNLNIPTSSSIVEVRIIDTTSHITDIPTSLFVQPAIKGYEFIDAPAYSFLIEHSSGRKLLFDLGVRKDYENLSPRISNRIKEQGWNVSVQKGVREQLEEHGIRGKDIEAVIWSHWHWDHTGDPSTFEPHTALIVGPGFKNAFVPGYPSNSSSVILETDYMNRELRELEFSSDSKIGGFDGLDYFGDGSFYLLDSPGHAIGHICGLARVSTAPDTFILMGGDACHHGGEFRPSKYHPLPDLIFPHPLDIKSQQPCPGTVFEPILRNGNKSQPFYGLSSEGASDVEEAARTIEKVIGADASADIFVVMAHDDSLLGVVDFFPMSANGFKEKGWVEKGRWAFLKDFKRAVNQ